jgi:hypothetical protein
MTDSNQKPPVPNYVPDVGRLATDRYDFQEHVNGTAFRHNATQIDLLPHLTISSHTYTDVQGVLAALVAIVNPPTINPATNSSLGIIQLSGDLAGNNLATNPKVSGIQGFAISPTVPSPGQVLTWGGSSWAPATTTNSVVWAQDLAGSSNTLQQVVGITGQPLTGPFAGLTGVRIHCNALIFDASIEAAPIFLIQDETTTTNGNTLIVEAQSSTTGNGGNLVLAGGSGQEVPGVVLISDGFGNQMLQLGNINRRFTTLNLPGTASTGDMPFNSGDLVTLIANAATPPVVGSPSGAIIYGNGGQLWVTQSDNTSFQVGSVPNPSAWGATPAGFTGALFSGGGYTYTARAVASTNSTSIQPLLSFTVPTNTSVRVDAIVIGRNTANTDSAQFNLSLGISRFTGSATAIGTTTSADSRSVGGATSWTTTPTISLSSNTVTVSTGANAATNISWTTSVQLVFG